MSAIAFFGAIELGLVYGIVAFGVFITFRLLNFPDLTVESTFPLGGAAAGVAILAGINPWLATLLAFGSGCIAGGITALLAVRFGILHLLASILTMIAGFSINIRIMGRPNIALLGEETIFTNFVLGDMAGYIAKAILVTLICVALLLILYRFLISEAGLALRATGQNERMVRMQGGNPGMYIYAGVMLSNGLVALGGAVFTQANEFADVTSGIGTIVFGLAAVILGETLLPSRKIIYLLLACLLGSVVYRLFIALALSSDLFGLRASDLNLVTAILVTLALIAPSIRKKLKPHSKPAA